MAEVFRYILIPGLDYIDLCSSLSSMATDLNDTSNSLTADLGPCYLTGTLSLYNLSFQSGDASSSRSSYERIQSHQKWCWQLSQWLLFFIQGYDQSHIIWETEMGLSLKTGS